MSRKDFKVKSELADKPEKFVQCESGGVRRESVGEEEQKAAALTDEQAVTISKLLMELEEAFGSPQDYEWGIEEGDNDLYFHHCHSVVEKSSSPLVSRRDQLISRRGQ